jgi:SHS family lactate transporter-like MFS transporter
LPALLALFVRFRVKESEVWQRTKQESWSNLFRTILSHWKVFAFIVVLMTAFNFVSHGTQDMYPTFLQRQWNFSAKQRAAMTMISAVGAIIGGTLFGLFSDSAGRRRAMITALMTGVLVIPIWAFAPSMGLLVAGAFLMQFMVQGAWGVIPAHLSELSPDSVRGFLPGFGYQCGVLIAGSVGYVETVLAGHTSYSIAMASTAAIVFVLAAAATYFSPERRAVRFGE